LAPAPIWYLQALALEKLGRDEQAQQIRARLPDVFPHGVMDAVGLLRFVGLEKLCLDLLELVVTRLPQHFASKVEWARTKGMAGDWQGQLAMLLRLQTEDPSTVPLAWVLEAAAAAGDWPLVERFASTLMEEAPRDSTIKSGYWQARGQRAGAMLCRGEGQERRTLLHQAPHHPLALSALVAIERRAQLAEAIVDEEYLHQVAPGAWRTLRAQKEGKA
jgi:hypothetical protein